MKANRRNYYRILHVQPEAPAEIVAASYRTLMSKLRQHPDLGGDPEQAVLINQAYAQLKDPEKRRAYDLRLQQRPVRTRPGPAAHSGDGCPFCGTERPSGLGPESRCAGCGSPLWPAAAVSQERPELFGRRRTPRTARSDAVAIHPGCRLPARAARLRDLSMTGVSVFVDAPLQAAQVVRIVAPAVDMLATVLACRRLGPAYVVHGRLLTVQFTRSRGVFVSTQA